MSNPSPRLILASASPRRQQLLREAGFAFTVHPADIDESDVPRHLTPAEVAEYLAVRKARAVAAAYPLDVVLAADTVVALGDKQLGKPADADHATAMLSELSGTTHSVVTGVCVRSASGELVRRVESTVRMRPLSPDEIRAYVASREWEGKAGGYGIQDNDPFVTNMAGSLTNIVGLPMEAARQILQSAGVLPMAR